MLGAGWWGRQLNPPWCLHPDLWPSAHQVFPYMLDRLAIWGSSRHCPLAELPTEMTRARARRGQKTLFTPRPLGLPAPSFSSSSLIKAVTQILVDVAHAIKIYTAFNLSKAIQCKYVVVICGVVIVMRGPPLPTLCKTRQKRAACGIRGPPGGSW